MIGEMNNFKVKVKNLKGMCVDKKVRKQGIGKKLIDAFSDIAKKKGAKYVKLNAFENNIPAISLYKKEGFEEYSVYYMKKI
jgi:ribosomal protein S18 acetylase RimI-like enzyme